MSTVRTIIHNGVMTVINNPDPLQQNLSDFYKHLDNFYKIDAQGQQIIQQNNQLIDQFNVISSQMQDELNHLQNSNIVAQPIQQIPVNHSWWKDFIDRGNFSNSSLNHGNDGILNPDYWSQFVVDVIKKAFWLLWNSFISVSHWLCLLFVAAGIIAYMAGWEKGRVVSALSIIIYVLLKLITMAMGG
ncbi:MAG: hypothetical protein Q8933_09325 [Bacteroidota bacterium]|nr:hypothetical protein [Bacteroidota bacterium]